MASSDDAGAGAGAAAGSTTDGTVSAYPPPSPSSASTTESLASFWDAVEPAPVEAMREAIRGMESALVDLVLSQSSSSSATPGRLADWLKVPLACATASGNLAAVERLLAAGVGTGPPSDRSRQPDLLLHTAAGSGNASVIEAILDGGASVGEVDRNRHDQTALHVAAASGRDAAVRAIASREGADVDAVDTRGWTPLHVAADGGHRGAVVFLLLKGANALLKTVREGDSPLHLAAANNHAGVIEDLLAVGNSCVGLCNNAGETALHVASRLHRIGACIALLRSGAKIGRVCSQGLSCLDIAAWRGHSPQLLQILTVGESPIDRSRRCGLALYYAAKANKSDTIRALVALGANVNTTRSGGNTNLHCTATRGADAATRALLQCGAYPEVVNNDGATPLHRACSFSHPSTVQLLLRWGADENATTLDNTTAFDLVGTSVEEELLSPEELAGKIQLDNLCRQLLVNAPADRIWRRRGWLVLCRARWLARVARVADTRELPRPSRSSCLVTVAAGGGASGGTGIGGSRAPPSAEKQPASKKLRRNVEGDGAGAGGVGSSASAAKAAPVSGSKGKGQAVFRETGGRGGAKSKGMYASGKGGESGGSVGIGKRAGRMETLIEVMSGGAVSTAVAAGTRVVQQWPELRLGKGSVLVEGGPAAGALAAKAETRGKEEPKSDFVGAVERLLLLREEGVFRDIVKFL